MPEYNVVISITTDDPAHRILKDLNAFLFQYTDGTVLNIEQYEQEETNDPPYPNDTTYPPNYPDNYPGHPL
jgi:hypothetical protein